MGVISDLENIKEKSVLAITGALLFTAPGLATVYTFNTALFLEQDVFKILLLAIAFIVPFVTAFFLPVLAIALALADTKKQQDQVTPGMVLAIDLIACNFIIYLWITLRLFYYYDFKGFVIRCFISAVVTFIVLLLISYDFSKKKRLKW
jgi:hypothetical protein